MAFELTEMRKAKLIDVVVLSQKNRQPDENPGAKLTVEMDLPSDQLVMFDGSLRSFLFTKNNGGQATIEGTASESLSPAGGKLGVLRWNQEQTGCTLTVDHGMGGRSNLAISDCTVSQWRMKPKDGGSFTLKCNIESADVSEAAFGRLAKLKSCEIQITLEGPEVVQRDIEQPTTPARNRKGAGKDNVQKGPWPFGDKGDKNAPATDDLTPEKALADSVGAAS